MKTLHDLLSKVVKEEHIPTLAQLETWSLKMKADAAKWAVREHIVKLGDSSVQRIPEPDFMITYKRKL